MDFDKQRRIMVDSQIRVNDVTDHDIVSAFLTVPREVFVASSLRNSAYAEYELGAGEGRALWTVRDLAKLISELAPESSDIGLVIGAGAGYSAAVLAQLTETVIALEDDEASVEAMATRFGDAAIDRAVAIEGPLEKGLPDQGPFNVIFVGGSVETVPDAWLDQLADGGRLGVVVQTARSLGKARIYTRAGDTVSYREAFECCPPVLPGFEAKAGFAF